MRRRGGVHVAEQAAAARVHQLAFGVHGDLAQPGQVDGQAAVRHGLACHVVAAAPDRGRQAVLAGHVDRGHHVTGAGAAQDQAGAPVDHGVPDQPRPLVVRVVRADDVAFEGSGQVLGDAQSQLLVSLDELAGGEGAADDDMGGSFGAYADTALFSSAMRRMAFRVAATALR